MILGKLVVTGCLKLKKVVMLWGKKKKVGFWTDARHTTQVFARDIGVSVRDLIESRYLVVTYDPKKTNVISLQYCACHPNPAGRYVNKADADVTVSSMTTLQQKFDDLHMGQNLSVHYI